MKRTLSCLLLLSLLSAPTLAGENRQPMEFTQQGIRYSLRDDYTASVIRCTTTDTEVDIPDSIICNGVRFAVTEIAAKAFADCPRLEAFRLPSSVRTVYRSAFESTAFYADKNNWEDGNLYLDSILLAVSPKTKGNYEMEDRVRIIASGAFRDCTKIRTLSLPEGIRCLAPHTFSGCTGLRDIRLPQSINCITPGAFFGTLLYGELRNWQDGVLYIGDWAAEQNGKTPTILYIKEGTRLFADGLFKGNKKIRQVVLPATLQRISTEAFSNCTALQEVVIGGQPDAIGAQAFLGCNSLEHIELPASVQSLGDAAFYGCEMLPRLSLPEGIQSLPQAVFYHCYRLDSVLLPASLREVEHDAFFGCWSLQQIVLPAKLHSLGTGAFFECLSLEQADLSACRNLQILPAYCFKRCQQLERVMLPTSLRRIEKEAFAEDALLTNIQLPDSVSFHPYAFSGCLLLPQYQP